MELESILLWSLESTIARYFKYYYPSSTSSSQKGFSLRFSETNFWYISHLSYACYVSFSSRPYLVELILFSENYKLCNHHNSVFIGFLLISLL
jgi:hypothetical protein